MGDVVIVPKTQVGLQRTHCALTSYFDNQSLEINYKNNGVHWKIIGIKLVTQWAQFKISNLLY